MKETELNDGELRKLILQRLYTAYRGEGLYRGVVSRKDMTGEFGVSESMLERNMEYLLDRRLVRMHKIDDLVSITPDGIDWIELGGGAPSKDELAGSLRRIEKLLARILDTLEKDGLA